MPEIVPLPLEAMQDYWVDAWQRGVLFLDVLRQRGNNAKAHNARTAPHVLSFAAELVLDGRTLERPVNYALVRIRPPAGTKVDERRRPFIVFDPRAGHGPGIGGMKHDSEIGMALADGHPCYFVGFLPEPMPGQTVEDVCRAEARFVAAVAERHPEADGKPCLIGNCQAGWQIMMMAAIRPELPGPIILAGSPLSYWAGVRGRNPMRYAGGLLGGTWLTTLAGDLGHGIFDGANLVANFEALNPANTLWKKPYNVYARVDTEAPRFLEFETWWGSPVLLNAGEMQTIADDLFVGNRLAAGQMTTSDGVRIDLRNIRSPIVVFCSWGDDITPPQQALGWLLDLYDHEDELVAAGQTVIYCLHQSVGHLGIFVSGKVATREHGELVQAMEMIDMMPPGLYEAVITGVDETVEHPELVEGRYLFTLEARRLDDIRALGGNTAEDERRFETAARVSEINRGLYEATLAPLVRQAATAEGAALLRRLHPNRLRFELFADDNPLMAPVAALAEQVRAARRPVDPGNPLLAMERAAAGWIETGLKAWGEARDAWQEALFLGVYGSPLLQAAVGLGAAQPRTGRRIERDLLREAAAARATAALETRFEAGGPVAAGIRALIYVRAARGSVDERGFAALRAIGAGLPPDLRVGREALKALFAEQTLLLRHDEARALATLPRLLPPPGAGRDALLEAVRTILAARGTPLPEEQARLARIEALFAAPPEVPRRGAGRVRLAAE
ncbi:MAG: DUF3141 domain-containing protein [Dongiaceae bacterium]